MRRGLWLSGFAALAAGLCAPVGLAAAADAPTSIMPAPSTANTTSAGLSTAASGDVILNGNPQASACQEAAKFGDFNNTGIDECSLALGGALLSAHDRAATYTDRGAIHMQHRQFLVAKDDFDAALALDPNLANAYVDRGGTFIALKRYAEAIADIDHGLSLGADQPEKAYYNRAIADENLKDLQTAYADYLKASELAPNWAPPKTDLARFNATGRHTDGP